MNLYNLVLFVHVLGALGLFVALGLEWTGLRNMRRAADADGLRPWLTVLASLRRLGPASLGALLLTGFYMTAALRSRMSWVVVSLAAMLVIGFLGGALTGRRFAALQRALERSAPEGSAADLRQLARHPQLWVSLQLRTGLSLAIVFLMTTKPAWIASLLAMAVAVALALATGPLLWRSTAESAESRATTPTAGRSAS